MPKRTFEALFSTLLTVWEKYQRAPRLPDRVPELAEARLRLDEVRNQTRQARLRLLSSRATSSRRRNVPRASIPTQGAARLRVRGMIGN